MLEMKKNESVTGFQRSVLVILRILIGWHFLYEGISKVLIPNWSAAGYMANSRGLFSGIFHWIASSPSILWFVDLLVVWGLVMIGLALFLGIFSRLAGIMGMILVASFYLANPPLITTSYGVVAEGHYLVVNKNLIELAALLTVIVFPTGLYFGLDRIMADRPKKHQVSAEVTSAREKTEHLPLASLKRREVLANLATVPFLGALAYGATKKYRWEKVNAISSATIQVSDSQLKDLNGELPRGKIKGKSISRLIMGGNLIGGWSHSRDLIYVSSLFKAYNHEEKVFETLNLAEMAGINTINITFSQFPLINKYKRIYGSKLQTISQVHPTREDLYGNINIAIDAGVDLIQIQGNCCDWRVRAGEIDVLEKAVEYIRNQGYPAGLGAHSVQALMECGKAGIKPDFYMKTFHHDQYWSAHPRENRIPFSVDGEKSTDHNSFHDNMFCLFPEETIDFMKNTDIPFIAFKILAGGAIHPTDGFKFAFENGADFICVGMFDYQIIDDVNIALDTLGGLKREVRPWCA